MSRILLTIVIFCLMLAGARAQRIEILQFREMVFDFGEIEELDGPVEHMFSFLNVSDKPVTISSVRASCGCTTPGWSSEPIAPGASGFVKARYNPAGRPGAFNKFLDVVTDPAEGSVRLYIKGKVDPKPRTVEMDYPVEMGHLQARFRVLNMGRVKLREDLVKKSFPVYNSGDMPLVIDSLYSPEHLSISFQPEAIPAKSPGQIIVTLDPMLSAELGFHNENITIWTNEPADRSMKSFSVYTNIEEYFSPMTEEELEVAPLLGTDRSEHDFGRVEQGDILNATFILLNEGKSELIIRKVETNCSCVSADMTENRIAPSDSVELEVAFDTRNRRSRQQKSITIYSNSPKRPVTRLILKAYVEEN